MLSLVEHRTVHMSKNELVVQCGAGALALRRIQPQGKPSMHARDFLNGLRAPLRILG